MALSDYITTQPVGQPQQLGRPAGTPSYMGGTLPAQQFQMPVPGGLPSTGPMPLDGVDYNTRVSQSLEHFMDPNSAYIQNARQRGAEQAAVRGGVNSSIAAGASERAALEAAMPLAQTAAGMQAGVDQARLNEWAAQQGFRRELYMRPFASSMNMLERVTEMGLQDPELYSPSVISGYSNFFNQQMGDMMRRYFGG